MATLFQPTQEVKREGNKQIRKLLNNRSLEYPETVYLQDTEETVPINPVLPEDVDADRFPDEEIPIRTEGVIDKLRRDHSR
ncbi:hypothetical protein TNCV_3235031 [Trichonephila clavipes]|nr:hypothetical protein TNCV_3235031 [Trichonephila clavipes]